VMVGLSAWAENANAAPAVARRMERDLRMMCLS
jgi:hypothetical protein